MGGYLKLGASAATSEFCFVYIPHSSIRISAQKPSKNICLSSASEIFFANVCLGNSIGSLQKLLKFTS